MWRPLGAFVLVALAVSSVPADALAQPWTGERWVRGRPHRISGEAAFYVRDDQIAFSPSVAARFRLFDDNAFDRDSFMVDLDLAWRAIGIAGPADSFRAGNPFAGIRFGWREPTWRLRVGAGTTAPLTNAYRDGSDDYVAYGLGQALHGGWDGWLLEPEIQPLIIRADFELHGQWFEVGVDAAFGAAFPVRNGGGGNTEVALESGVFVAVTPIPELALGGRFQFWFATDWRGFGGVDEAQLSIIPIFIRLELERFFAEARLLVNLDEPYGFAFDDGVWTSSLILGGRF